VQPSVQIVFHDLSRSEALERKILERANRLEHFHPHLLRCHVTVGQPHRHKQQGNLFHVRVALRVPGEEIVIDRNEEEDVYAAVNDAFDAARHRLEEAASRHRARNRTARPAAGARK